MLGTFSAVTDDDIVCQREFCTKTQRDLAAGLECFSAIAIAHLNPIRSAHISAKRKLVKHIIREQNF